MPSSSPRVVMALSKPSIHFLQRLAESSISRFVTVHSRYHTGARIRVSIARRPRTGRWRRRCRSGLFVKRSASGPLCVPGDATLRQALRVVISAIILSLILSVTVLHADSHEVRYTPSAESYGACRAQFPYSHFEDCNKDYDFLMLFWLEHLESQAEPIVYDSCDAAEAAGISRQQGSIGD